MFYGCTSLKKAPKLPAETPARDCYDDMFQNCSSLTEVWLNAKTNVGEGLNGFTFNGCPSTGVTAHIRKDRDYKNIWTLLKQKQWIYVDIETGEHVEAVDKSLADEVCTDSGLECATP